MAINNPEDVANTLGRQDKLRQDQQSARNDQLNSDIQEDEDQNPTSDTKTPNEPKEKLTGIFFWMIFAANCVKDFTDLIIDASIYLVILIFFTTIFISTVTSIYLLFQRISLKKRIFTILINFILEWLTFGVAPSLPFILLVLKFMEKNKFSKKVGRYLSKINQVAILRKVVKYGKYI